MNSRRFPSARLPLDPIWLGGFMFTAFAHSAFAAFPLHLAGPRNAAKPTQRNFAMSDPLTGLMNRRAFQAVRRAQPRAAAAASR